MLSYSRIPVSFNKLCHFLNFYQYPYFFFLRKSKSKSLLSNCICPLNFSTSSSLLVIYDKGTKANLTEEEDIRMADIFKTIKKDPKLLKQGFINFGVECGKYYEECKSKFTKAEAIDFNKNIREIDIPFKFETEEELNNFVVSTDEKIGGSSKAHFKLTQDKTGLFYGTLSTEIPKDGNVRVSGYVNIMSKRPVKSFKRPAYLDWTNYTHLVLKVRGDGRSYLILLATPDSPNVTWNNQYSHPLYTRGGPYWQITKIPFTHFILSKKARVEDHFPTVPLNLIARLGISLGDSNDGPFKLEIDYIGLEKQEKVNCLSPYETYVKF